ncbi:MAG: phosphoribosyltransferase family protein [bacterium]|nr:phosphoribosyltransferase family protein [bacterium]
MSYNPKIFKIILRTLLEFFFPQRCAGCGAARETLCLACLKSIEMPDVAEANGIYAASNYHDRTVKNAIRLLKYKKGRCLAKPLAELIKERCLPKIMETYPELNAEDFIAIPIPLSAGKLRERGFNQAAEMAKLLPLTTNNKILFKTKETSSQVSVKDRDKRLKNIEGCFITKNVDALKGKNIIIIDDVFTTGATIKETKKTLKAGGARKVLAIVLARG